jgi:DNA gyrase inhibitor GyrI
MSQEPQIQARAAQHYAAIPATVAMSRISAAVDEAFPELFGWLAGQGIAPVGPPLIRYLVIDMAGELQLALGVPVAAPVTASGRVQPGVLPEGRYAVLRHTGPYDGLAASNAALLQGRRRKASRSTPGKPPGAKPGAAGPSTTSPTRPRRPTRPSLKPTWLS